MHLSMLSWSYFTQYSTKNILSKPLAFLKNYCLDMDSGERGINPVTMTIFNPQKEYWLSHGLNQQPPVLKSCVPPTELWGLAQMHN